MVKGHGVEMSPSQNNNNIIIIYFLHFFAFFNCQHVWTSIKVDDKDV